jgi:hypothetical protein
MEVMDKSKQAQYRHRVLVIGVNVCNLNDALMKRFRILRLWDSNSEITHHLTETDYIVCYSIKQKTTRGNILNAIRRTSTLSWDEIYVYGTVEKLYTWMIEDWPTAAVYSVPPGSEYGLLNPSSLKNNPVR